MNNFASDFENSLNSLQQERAREEVGGALYQAAIVDPDAHAKDIALSKQTGLPIDQVAEDRAGAEMEARKLSPLEISRLMDETPEAAEFWKNHAKLTSDDFSLAAKWKKNWRDLPESILDSRDTQRIIELNDKEMGGQLTPAEDIELQVLNKTMNQQPQRGTGGYLSEGFQGLGSNSIQMGRTIGAGGVGALAGGAVGAAAGAVVSVPSGETAAPIVVPTFARIGARIGGGAGAAYENYKQQSRLINNDIMQIRDESGNTIDRDIRIGASTIAGIANAGLDTIGLGKVLENFPGFQKIKGNLTREGMKKVMQEPTLRKAFLNIGKRFAEGVAVEGTTEGIQQLNQIVAEELSKQIDDGNYKGKTFDEAMTEIADAFQGGASMATVLGGVGATHSAVKEYRAPRTTPEQTFDHVAKINEAVRSDKLFQRSPEAFKSLMDGLTGEDKFYVNAKAALDAVNTLDQSQRDALFNASPELMTELDTAAHTDSDVAIKKSDYATFIAPYQQADMLAEHIKLDPEDTSIAERRAIQEALIQNPSLAREVSSPAPDINPEIISSLERQVRAALKDSGRSNMEAKALSSLYARKIARDATALGLNPLEEFQKSFLGFETVNDAGEAIQQSSNIDSLLFEMGKVDEVDKNGKYKLDDATRASIKTFQQKLETSGISPEQARQMGGRAVFEQLYPEPTRMDAGDAEVVLPQVDVTADANGQLNLAISAPDTETRGNIEKLFQRPEPTQTEEFKKWFGDSKVVDENGDPLVVYHGTGYDFEAFDTSKIGERGTSEGYGFYFTSDRDTAAGYVPQGSGNLIEAYLSIQKPLDVNQDKFDNEQVEKIIKQMIESEIANNPEDLSDYKDSFISNFVDTYRLSYDKAVAETARVIVDGNDIAIDQVAELANVSGGKDSVFSAVKAVTGFDGIKSDGFGGNGKGGGTIYIAWFPTQIKSAKNNGAFSPTDSRILYQAAYHGSPYKFDRFTLDHIGKGEGNQAYGWGLYFAGKSAVADFYKKGLSGRKLVEKMQGLYDQADSVEVAYNKVMSSNVLDESQRAALEKIRAANPEEYPHKALMQAIAGMSDVGAKAFDPMHNKAEEEALSNLGQLYKVDIPEDTDLLSWDGKIKDQPEKVKKILDALPADDVMTAWKSNGAWDNVSGAALHAHLTKLAARNSLDVGKMRYELGTDPAQAVSRYLNSLGIKGIKYLDAGSRTANTYGKSHNYVIFDDKSVAMLESLSQGGERGSITFIKNAMGDALKRVIVSFTKQANLSTGAHEFAHYGVAMHRKYAQLAREKIASGQGSAEMQRIADDWEKLKQAVGATTDKFTVEQEEKIARMFEGYLRTGAAPSEGLRSVFARFREWMTAIYSDARVAGIEVHPEVAEVFDRWLASEQEIESVKAKNSALTELASSLNLEETVAQRLQTYIDEARTVAEDKLYRQMTREQRRKEKKAYREELAKQREKVRSEKLQEKGYKAIQYLKDRQVRLFLGEFDETVGAAPPVEEGDYGDAPSFAEIEAMHDASFQSQEERSAIIQALLAPKPKKPQSLLEFLNSRRGLKNVPGLKKHAMGVKDEGGELSSRGLTKLINNKSGMSLDHAREAAVEAGYLQDISAQEGGVSGSDINQLLDAIDAEMDGNPVYAEADMAEAEAVRNYEQLQQYADQYGITGEEIAKARLDRQKRGAYSTLFTTEKDDAAAVDPDLIAELVGYDTGAQLIKAIRSTPSLDFVVNREARKRLLAKFPDMVEDGRIHSEAISAVMNDKTLLAIDLLIKEIGKAKGSINTSGIKLFAKAVAQQQVSKMLAKDSGSAYRFEVGREKSLREALKASRKGNPDEAVRLLYNAMVNQMVYKQLQSFDAMKERAQELFDRVDANDKELSKRADLDFIGAARFILYKYGLGGEDFDVGVWKQDLSKADPLIQQDLAAAIDAIDAPRKPAKELTVAEYRQIYNSIKNIYHAARGMREFVREEKKFDTAKVVSELIETMGNHKQTDLMGNTQLTGINKFRRNLLSIKGALRRVELWTEAMDGKTGGAFKKYLWTPVNRAEDAYISSRQTWLSGYRDILKKHKATLKNGKKIFTGMTRRDALGRTTPLIWNGKHEMIGFLLHTGNQSNLDKLLGGYGISQQEFKESIERMEGDGTITAEDWKLVQELWNYVEGLKPLAQKAHKELYGFRFDEIEPTPVNTKYGTFSGGYWPAIADADQANDGKEIDEIISDTNRYMLATVNKGMLKSRVEQYKAPLKTDLRLGSQHIDKMLRFIHLEPAARQVAHIINNRDFRENLSAIDAEAQSSMLIPWLQRFAAQSTEPNNAAGDRSAQAGRKLLNYTRSAAMRQLMHYNPVVALQNFANMTIVSHLVGKRNLARSFAKVTMNPSLIRHVEQASKMMEQRNTVESLKISQELNEIAEQKRFNKPKDFMVRNGTIFMRGIDMYLSTVSWVAGYDKAISEGKTDQQAIDEADSVVRKSQGARGSKDVAKIEASHPAVQFLMPFYGYFNSQLNLQQTEFGNLMREYGWKGAPKMFMSYISLILAPALVGQLIVDGLRDRLPDDGDDDGEVLDDWLAWFMTTQLRYLAAELPIAGQGINAAVNAMNKNPMDDRLTISPAVSAIETSIRYGKNLASDKDVDDSRMVQDALTTIGFATGLPLGQFGKPLGYYANIQEGDQPAPENPLEAIQGVIAGPRRERK